MQAANNLIIILFKDCEPNQLQLSLLQVLQQHKIAVSELTNSKPLAAEISTLLDGKKQ